MYYHRHLQISSIKHKYCRLEHWLFCSDQIHWWCWHPVEREAPDWSWRERCGPGWGLERGEQWRWSCWSCCNTASLSPTAQDPALSGHSHTSLSSPLLSHLWTAQYWFSTIITWTFTPQRFYWAFIFIENYGGQLADEISPTYHQVASRISVKSHRKAERRKTNDFF